MENFLRIILKIQMEKLRNCLADVRGIDWRILLCLSVWSLFCSSHFLTTLLLSVILLVSHPLALASYGCLCTSGKDQIVLFCISISRTIFRLKKEKNQICSWSKKNGRRKLGGKSESNLKCWRINILKSTWDNITFGCGLKSNHWKWIEYRRLKFK